jgi:hypothetical protein
MVGKPEAIHMSEKSPNLTNGHLAQISAKIGQLYVSARSAVRSAP